MAPIAIIREKIENVILLLHKALQGYSLYGKDHRITRESEDAFYNLLSSLLAECEQITLGIIGDEFAFEKEPLYEISKKKQEFLQKLKAVGITKIAFNSGLQLMELVKFVQILAIKIRTPERIEDIHEFFNKKKIIHISVDEIQVGDQDLLDGKITNIDEFTKNTFNEGIEFLEDSMKACKENQPLNIQALRHVSAGLIKSLLVNKNLLVILTSVRLHDEETFVHNLNVCIFTLLQAEMLGIDKPILTDIAAASLLHNIGNLGKPKRAEYESVDGDGRNGSRELDILGAKILLRSEAIPFLAPIAAYEHNIHYDSVLTSEKLYGETLNLTSMMIGIAKAYDQLRRRADYLEKNGMEGVYSEMMTGKGKWFHPDLLNNFFSVLGVYPPGTLVELDTGEIGLVIQASLQDIRRPHLEILYDFKGKKYKHPQTVSLLERNRQGQFARTIVKSISPHHQYELPDKYTSDTTAQ